MMVSGHGTHRLRSAIQRMVSKGSLSPAYLYDRITKMGMGAIGGAK